MSTLATTNIKHESASTPNITLTSGGATTVNGTLNLGSSPLATPTGSAPSYTCRAWVNFDGTGVFSPNPSTTKIRASGNVSSITDNGTGDYTVNFTTAMPDVNYGVVTSSSSSQAIVKTADSWGAGGTNPTTTSIRVFNRTGGSTAEDPPHAYVAIFR